MMSRYPVITPIAKTAQRIALISSSSATGQSLHLSRCTISRLIKERAKGAHRHSEDAQNDALNSRSIQTSRCNRADQPTKHQPRNQHCGGGPGECFWQLVHNQLSKRQHGKYDGSHQLRGP